MLARLYAKWMYAWETALTTRDENRVERPLEWGFEHLACCADGSWADGEGLGVDGEGLGRDGLEAMIALNRRIVAEPQKFYGYTTPTDFRLEMHFPALYPTNVRPETLEQEREWKRRAEVGELRKEPFLRFTSPAGSGYPENDVVNA